MEHQDTLPGIDWSIEEVDLRAMGQQALFNVDIEGDN